ncbi:hypothetical protein ACIOD2_30310 [Amycolatopsis sp. NPDC088138]|uniref:hypothetical protein n=1 Tax=Amycolatopsis sp. NPDC088138 TaxID=3363938 RepID=UPI00381AA886
MIGLLMMSVRLMVKLSVACFVLSFAMAGWAIFAIVLLVSPNKAAASRNMRQFNHSVSRAMRRAL